MKKIIKKINIIIVMVLVIGIGLTNNVLAVGDAFESADDFLGKRRFNI